MNFPESAYDGSPLGEAALAGDLDAMRQVLAPAECVRHLTVAERARELRALAGYTHAGDIDPDVAEGLAVRNWVAATLPDAPGRWEDYRAAVGLLTDLDAGIVAWQDVEPDLTGWNRHETAVELAHERTAEAMFPLLFGPEAVPCDRCRRGCADVWQPATVDGLCGRCADREWIGGRP